jgi:starch synthase
MALIMTGILNTTIGLQNNTTNIPYTIKVHNKMALQARLNLPVREDVFMLGLISRLVDQKGIDLILDCLYELLGFPLQIVILGSGDKGLEHRLNQFALAYPYKMSLTLGYDESLAHLIEAGVDVFLMPSRFEPCGLNRMYSQRYGTLPIVRSTGGLADTVIDALPATIEYRHRRVVLFLEKQQQGHFMKPSNAPCFRTVFQKVGDNCK